MLVLTAQVEFTTTAVSSTNTLSGWALSASSSRTDPSPPPMALESAARYAPCCSVAWATSIGLAVLRSSFIEMPEARDDGTWRHTARVTRAKWKGGGSGRAGGVVEEEERHRRKAWMLLRAREGIG